MKNPKKILFFLITGFILTAALTRLFPHPPNFTPVIAIALIAGTYFSRTAWAWAVPLFVMLVSDLGLWWLYGYDFFNTMRLVIYLSLIAIVAIGIPVGRQIRATRVAGGSLAGALLFFIVTNFTVWLGGTLYPMTLEGLIACYTAAIPYFRNTLFSTLLYAGLMYGVIEWAKIRWNLPARIERQSLYTHV
ncbi:MAG: DUF6580 family putative transport protein [Balneolaceae bacterium]